MNSIASRILRSAAALAVAGGLLATGASPASAARHMEQSASIMCTNSTVAVAPPRVWASGNRPEAIVWLITLERWNGRSWARYSQSSFVARFDYYGRNTAGWSVYNTRTGGRFINSRMHVPVSDRGYYRVGSAVAISGPARSSAVYVGGAGNYCGVAV
jgi:hypothetical protein